MPEKIEKVYLRPEIIKICGKEFHYSREEIKVIFEFFENLENLRNEGFGEISLQAEYNKIKLGKLYKTFK